MRDFNFRSNRGNPVENHRFSTNADKRCNALFLIKIRQPKWLFARQINACGVVFCLWQNWIATILLTQNLAMILECFRQPETLEPDGNKFKTEYQTMGSRRPKSGAVTKLLSFGVKQ
ncbi:MAG: hypothetical protein IKG79_06880 [Neisseriaceae bacterium]|nr:hypothetical protein [Neisseriaceae bacterium]